MVDYTVEYNVYVVQCTVDCVVFSTNYDFGSMILYAIVFFCHLGFMSLRKRGTSPCINIHYNII